MNKILSQETFKHKDRTFIIKTIEKSDAFYVYVIDPKTDKVIDTGLCNHIMYTRIREEDPSKDPVEELADVLKMSMALLVDKELI